VWRKLVVKERETEREKDRDRKPDMRDVKKERQRETFGML